MEVKGPLERYCSALEQLTLADFITSGAYDRHVRAMRLRYRRRRDQLVAALASRVPYICLKGIAAGLHLVLRLPAGTGRSVVRAMTADPEGCRLPMALLRDFHYGPGGSSAAAQGPGDADDPGDAVVVGYCTLSDHVFTSALDALCHTLRTAAGSHPRLA
jgi:GntR family transcriptional regulator/MocR family aminotransferase